MLPHFLSFPLAGIMGLGAPELILIAAIIGFGLAALALILVGLRFFFRDRERRRWHETARLAVEKGQPLPPQFQRESNPSQTSSSPSGDFRSGLILVGTGIGLYFFLGLGVAAVVGCIGVALLLYAVLATIFSRKSPPQDPPSRS